MPNYSLSTDGTGVYTAFPFPAIAAGDPVGHTGDYAVAFWLKLLNVSGSFIAVTDNAGARTWTLFLDSSGNNAGFGGSQMPGGGSFGAGSWHLIVVSRSLQTITAYVDVASVTSNFAASSASAMDFHLGDNASGGGSHAQAKYADLRLYSAALSGSDVAALAAGTDVTTNLVRHWGLTEGTGTTVGDSVGGNTATWGGAAWDSDVPSALSGGGGTTTPISSSDSGTGTEGTPTLLRSSTSAETGAGTDAATLAAAVAGAETATGTDAATLLALLATVADTGLGTEGTPTILAGLAQADTATGADSGSIVATLSSPDSGTATDAGSVFAGLTLSDSDSGTGTEGAATLAAALAAADPGAGLDAATLVASLAAADIGAGTDAGTVFSGITVADSDSGTGTEGTPTLLVAASSPDTASGADAGSIAATLSAGDSGSGIDASSLVQTLFLSSADSGTAADAASIEDVTGAITIQVSSADSGAGLEVTVVLVAALDDAEDAAATDGGWVLVGTVDAPYRDRQLLRLIADALRDTGEFDEVLTCGLPEDHGRAASDLRLACLELEGFDDADDWGDFESTEQIRTVHYALHLLVRHEDPDLRDDEVDRLVAVCANALNGIPLGDVSIPNKTRLLKGRYQPAAGVERRIKVAGTFVYLIPDFDRHTAEPDA